MPDSQNTVDLETRPEQPAAAGAAAPGPIVAGKHWTLEEIYIDLPVFASSLGHVLHKEGIPVTPDRASHFVKALTLTKPDRRRRLYWTARSVFVSGHLQVPAFNRVWAAFFPRYTDQPGGPDMDPSDLELQAPDNSSRNEAEAPENAKEAESNEELLEPGDMSMSESEEGDGEGEDEEGAGTEREIPILLSSEEEVLSERSFASLSAKEIASLYRLMSRLQLATPTRVTRRKKRSRHGDHLDMRRTLRQSMRTAGDPVKLARRKRRVHRRRLVMLCDISGSMESYARAYLQFLHCGTGSGPDAEAFAFATRLTRLTRALSGKNPERAIRRAAEEAPDWSSGTRIGDALKTFNDRHGRRGMARGAVVVIISDGWERGDPELLAREMERLRRLAYRIVWVNPRVSAAGFAPRAGGMAAALPYCDALVSGHSLNALHQVADAIAADLSMDLGAKSTWRPPSAPDLEEDEETWGSAEPVMGTIAMPSGYGPYQGNITG